MAATQMNLSDGDLILTTDSTADGGLEPSGLAYYGNEKKIYIASDNGIIARMNTDGSKLENVYQNTNGDGYGDFESITTYQGMVLVGVEGGDENGAPTHAKVQQFDTGSDTIDGYDWKLNDPTPEGNDGMEALTSYSSNIYLTSFQCSKGNVYVYKLTGKNSGSKKGVNSQSVFALPSPKSGKQFGLSDLYWHNKRQKLYALYDSGDHWLQELSLTVTNGVFSATQTNLWLTPVYDGSSADWEACMFIGNNLYLGLDRSKCTANVVYMFPNFGN